MPISPTNAAPNVPNQPGTPNVPNQPGTGSGRDSVDSKEKIEAMRPQLEEASKKTGVPFDVLAGIMIQESRGVSVNDMLKNNGLMQLGEAEFNSEQAEHPELKGLAWNSPEGQILGTAFRLADFKRDHGGDWYHAAALYNGGEFGGGHLNDPNYLNSLHETIYDIDNNLPIPS
jgi:soluble lytic murein transglycosylase-like protein